MTDFYVHEISELNDYKCNANVIVNEKYLKYLARVKYKEHVYEPQPAEEWYPRCNSYYPYTEDVDAINRVNHLLASKKYMPSIYNFDIENRPTTDLYSESEAQLNHLYSNPTNFIILGKPGIGEQRLAKMLADYWKCVYIDPEVLVEEEIRSGSRPGQCMEFNLRCGRAIAVDVILRLVEKRVRSKSAEHRGFVICGFPLIRNDMYQEDPVSSESAVFTVQDIFEEILEPIGGTSQVIRNVSQTSHLSKQSQITVNEDEDEEQNKENSVEEEGEEKIIKVEEKKSTRDFSVDIGSAASAICKITNIGTNYSEQINFLFSLCQKPLIIIYIMCHNTDVVEKHENYRYDLMNHEVINLQRDQTENIVYTIYTKNPGFDSEDLPEDIPGGFGEHSLGLANSEMMYLTYLPRDFSGNVAAQLEQYRFEALPTIEKYVLLHDPQYFIKVDGRISPTRMFNIVKTKLRILPLPRVIIPEKMVIPTEPVGGEGGGDEIDPYDFDQKSPEECFEVLRSRQTVNRMFKYDWSRWKAKCPVSMKDGSYIDGSSKYAVRFMNKIFFLSSEAAVAKFSRNPRPYLLPPCPRSRCKIFIIGPKSSGKSAIANCLALLLDGKVLDPSILQSCYFKRKEKQFLDKVRSDAINEGVILLTQMRKEDYEKMEIERQEMISKWTDEQMDLIEERIQLQILVREVPSVTHLSSFPLRQMSTPQVDLELYNKHIEEFNILKIKFEQNGLPFFDDMKLCEEFSHAPSKLKNYLPEELKIPAEKPQPVNVFDDFVTEYADAAVDKASYTGIEMSLDDTLEMYMTAIKETEEQNIREGENHGGWIIDGVPPNIELVDRLITECEPDDIFVLKDSGGTFLLNRFHIKGQNEFRNYREFFSKLGKTRIAMKAPSLTSTVSYKSRMARDIIQDILDDDKITGDDMPKDEENEFLDVDYFSTHATRFAISQYETDLKTFEEDCEELLIFFNENELPYVEIDVVDKSIESIMEEAVIEIDNRFQLDAHEFTPEERLQEVEDFGDREMVGEDIDEEDEIPADSGNIFLQNRRLGDTNIYCPVTYHKYGVLWKGKEEYAAKYENKLYFYCNVDAMDEFIMNPRQYLDDKPPLVPAPRICVVGVAGSGKTTLSKALSKKLGLYYVCYSDLLRNLKDEMSSFVAETNAQSADDILNPDELLDEINLKRIWFEEPIKSCGFVLDGYPRHSTDIEYMEKCLTIPDVILEIFTSDVEVNRRHVQKLLDEWKEKMNEAREQHEKLKNQQLSEWTKNREVRIRDLREMKRQERYQTKIEQKSGSNLETVPEESGKSSDRSQISYDSVAEEAELEEVMKIVDVEYPEPDFDENWETLEEATERIISQTEGNFVNDTEFYRLLKDYCETELVDWFTVDGNLSAEKVFDQALRAVDKIKFRNESFFERCYDVNLDVAEKLLDYGYYLTSGFGKLCPVQLYEKFNPVLMFLPMEQKFQVFPVIHRNYIYFLGGKSNRDKFVDNPLKYVMQEKADFPLIPFKIAIIGPPKSGKTVLAERFKRDLGFRYISIGQAARYVLRFLPNSKLAKMMESVLRNGWELTSEMTIKCVEAMAFDGKGITQGLVLDGFPNSKDDVDHLAEVGLVPNLVIDLQAKMDEIYEFLDTDKGKRGLPAFSRHFIKHRCEEWCCSYDKFRDWFDQEYQVLARVHVNVSKWGVWTAAYELMTACAFEMKHYYKNCHKDMALRLANMQVKAPREQLTIILSVFGTNEGAANLWRHIDCGNGAENFMAATQQNKVPAFLTVVDIAGLVKGASEGQGLGNAFLSHISACDAIFHLCRAFEDDDVTHIEGDVNPVRDLEIIGEELRLKDEELLNKYLEKLERAVVRGNDKKMKPEYDALVKVKGVLVDQKQHIRFADWHVNDIEILNKYLFLTSKPMIYLVNLSEKDYIKKKNKWLLKLKEWVAKNDPGAIIIPFSGALEQKLVEIEDPVLRKKYLEDHCTTSALEKIIVQGYKALQLEYFFTSGTDEVKAWTIQKGTKAPQAAGKIHTDFEKGFIMAEVMKFNDFKDEGSETAVKAAGKYRQQGRNYVVEDGDIIFFKFNAGAGLKDSKKK